MTVRFFQARHCMDTRPEKPLMKRLAFLLIVALIGCDSEPPTNTSESGKRAAPNSAPTSEPAPAPTVTAPNESAFVENACDLEMGHAALNAIVQHNRDNPDEPIGSQGVEHWQILQRRYEDALAAVDNDEAFVHFWVTHGKAPDVYFSRDAPYYRVVDGVPGAIEELKASSPDRFVSTLVTAAYNLAERGDSDRLEELASAALEHASTASDWVDTAGIFAIIGNLEAAESALANIRADELPVENQSGSHHLLVSWSRTLGPKAAMDRFFELVSKEWILPVLNNASVTLFDEGKPDLVAQMVTDPRILEHLRRPSRSYMSHDSILALVDRFSETDATLEIVAAVMANIGEQRPVSALSSTDFLIRGLARYGCSQACLDAVLEHMPAKDAVSVGTSVTVASTRNVVLAATGRLAEANMADSEALMLAAGSYAAGMKNPDYIAPLAQRLPASQQDRLYSFTAISTAMGRDPEDDTLMQQFIRSAPMSDLSQWAGVATMTQDNPEVRRLLLTRATGGCPAATASENR